jgi:hypothetical protein
MKKTFQKISLAIVCLLVLSIITGCAGGYTIDSSKLVGVWTIEGNGGVCDITRIEFKAPYETGGSQGSYSYYKSGGKKPYYGTWSEKAGEQNAYTLVPDETADRLVTYRAVLAGGELLLEYSDTATIYYRKIKD